MDLERIELFSIPVWRSRVPEFEPHAGAVMDWVMRNWERGAFRRHAYGYGYQTPSMLFSEDAMKAVPALRHLKDAFRDRVLEILKERTNHTVHLPPEAYAFMAWVLVQTNEDWVSGTWHDHFSATISGCYYLKMPATEHEEEGALAFQRPGSPDAFVEQMQWIKPAEGDMILFPSYLTHRPQPCPSASGIRVSINMDAYIHWTHWHEEGKPRADPKEYEEKRRASLKRKDS